MIKRFDPRILIGALLILAGALGIFQAFGFLRDASDFFWGIVFLAAGAVFLFVFASGFAQGNWWAAFPGFVLAGLGLVILLPDALDDLGGAVFLGGISLSFWAVYLTGRDRWWAIIPGGVLLTLAAITVLPEESFGGEGSGGVLFLGLALTFLLVALLAKMSWAFWPAGALGVLGIFLFLQTEISLFSYLAAGALIIAGIFMVLRALRSS